MSNTRLNIEDIYHRQIDTLYRFCFLFMKNHADTEDAVQTTFIKLVDRARKLLKTSLGGKEDEEED